MRTAVPATEPMFKDQPMITSADRLPRRTPQVGALRLGLY
jgi:hypothetical protein